MTQTAKSISNNKIFSVYATVISSCKKLLPGMYVNAYIEQSDNKVTSLPTEAIVNFEDKDYIFSFEKEKEESGSQFTEYKMIEIKKGVSGSDYSEILVPEGFDINTTRIVIKGAYNLLSAKKNAGEMAC
jgi:cobalt-zinc-cadmium efflux system membrane fusion protein